jgi:DNA-binding transcriptional LysR family regulator
MTEDLNAMAVFAAVAEARGFRAAGERLGVSASAVSQTVRKLEGQLGVVLLQRSTRSVRLTEAGERLYAGLRPALEEVRAAVTAVGELSDVPRGNLRVIAGPASGFVFAGPLLFDFLTAYPEIKLDLVVSDDDVDIVAEGYDAGIQLGEVIDKDMIAVAVTGDIRMTVVGAPAYFARNPKPRHPRELGEHVCLNWHRSPTASPYRWEFTEPAPDGSLHGGREIAVAVPSRVLSTDSAVNIELARAGLGVTIVYEHQVRDDVARGALIPVLEEFCAPFPGYYLYYPQRRHASPALRALIEHLRIERQRGQTRRSSQASRPSRKSRR